MKAFFANLFLRAADWYFRRRSPALAVATLGAMVVIATSAVGFTLKFVLPSQQGDAIFSFDTADGPLSTISTLVIASGALLLVGGSVWEFWRWRIEHRRVAKKRVIALEVRGLRDTRGTPLSEAIPPEIQGRRESMLVDLRQVDDGVIVKPQAAIDELSTIPRELDRRCAEGDRSDVTVVYAGLAPVPMTFLTGVLLDDEQALVSMDWDRHQSCWRSLDGIDDGERFAITPLDVITPGTQEVVVAVSVSYGVDLAGADLKFPGLPRVELKLHGGTPDAHWAIAKQQALGQQFLNTMIALSNKGVKKIHLLLAAQNSVVFLMGRLYDKRNLPSVVVYQYEKHSSPPYPWGISMPVSGQTTAAVV